MEIRKCLNCEKDFYVRGNLRKLTAKFCSMKCKGVYFKGKPNKSSTNFKKGSIPKNKGMPCPDKIKGKISKTKKRLFKEGKLKPSGFAKKGKDNWSCKHGVWNKGKKLPELSGSKHPNWKGGITPLKNQVRNSSEYKIWRTKVFERDNWTCQTCGRRGKMNAHHSQKTLAQVIHENDIKTFEQAINCKEIWDLNNGVTLCLFCHDLTKYNRRKNGS